MPELHLQSRHVLLETMPIQHLEKRRVLERIPIEASRLRLIRLHALRQDTDDNSYVIRIRGRIPLGMLGH